RARPLHLHRTDLRQAQTPTAGDVPAGAVRAERVLETAAAHGYRRLVLGAWGCGVFQNDPAEVAGAFHGLLVRGRFDGHFEHVVFGVLDRTADRTTHRAFEQAFAYDVRGV
ncbi:TIGR02452 family protein, partial [Streptomyces sp. NPDC005534]|uniref:TIGR02452 family protein n=1 Tax=Streptomyces sp. NPDC005534 TaxID=3155714 RepID=UPI003454CFDE